VANTLNIGKRVIVFTTDICGAYTSVGDTVFSNNVLNINETFFSSSSGAVIDLYSCRNYSSFSNASSNMINISDGVTISDVDRLRLLGAYVSGSNVNSNKTNISPNVLILM
jgi:hypothetical protein